MSGTCSAYCDKIGAYRGLVGNLRQRDHLKDPGVDWRIILKWIFRKWDVVAWTGSTLLQDRDKWQSLVNAVMNLRLP